MTIVASDLKVLGDNVLEDGERDQLCRCEQVISAGLQTYYAVGDALVTIRDERLYRAEHATFEEYCRKRWQMSRSYAYRLIQAAAVVENLSPIGDKPANEAQARALAALPPDQQSEAWKQTVSTAPNGVVTTKQVHEVVQKFKPAEPKPSVAEAPMNDFFNSGAGAEERDSTPRKFADHIPTGHQISPVEPLIIEQLLAASRAVAVMDGGVLPPVWVFDRLWCPISAEVNSETGRCTIEAVRILRDADFLQAGYEEQLPTCTFRDWPGTNGEVERIAEDYAGLRVWSTPGSASVVLWYVLLPQRATFMGRLSAERQAAAITVSVAGADALQETTSTEAYDFPVMIGEGRLRKLEMLVAHLNRNGGALTLEELVEDMIDARFEASCLDLADYQAAVHGD